MGVSAKGFCLPLKGRGKNVKEKKYFFDILSESGNKKGGGSWKVNLLIWKVRRGMKEGDTYLFRFK